MNMYFIAVVLPPNLAEKVKELKLWMLEHYECKVALKSPAHITIVPPFWLPDSLETDLTTDIDTLSTNTTPFTLHTHHFSTFAPRTIFIEVPPNNQLSALHEKAADHFARKEVYKIKRDNRPFHPHITIANRDLSKKAFHEAWAHFKDQLFEANWQADSLSLLKHNTKSWDVAHTAAFAMSST